MNTNILNKEDTLIPNRALSSLEQHEKLRHTWLVFHYFLCTTIVLNRRLINMLECLLNEPTQEMACVTSKGG